MANEANDWVGVGKTPRAAVRDLAPSPSQAGVAWVEGLKQFSDSATPGNQRGTRTGEITVLYETNPVKQWRVTVTPRSTTWHATFIGGKKLPFG